MKREKTFTEATIEKMRKDAEKIDKLLSKRKKIEEELNKLYEENRWFNYRCGGEMENLTDEQMYEASKLIEKIRAKY